jgi:hypothetical protein
MSDRNRVKVPRDYTYLEELSGAYPPVSLYYSGGAPGRALNLPLARFLVPPRSALCGPPSSLLSLPPPPCHCCWCPWRRRGWRSHHAPSENWTFCEFASHGSPSGWHPTSVPSPLAPLPTSTPETFIEPCTPLGASSPARTSTGPALHRSRFAFSSGFYASRKPELARCYTSSAVCPPPTVHFAPGIQRTCRTCSSAAPASVPCGASSPPQGVCTPVPTCHLSWMASPKTCHGCT